MTRLVLFFALVSSWFMLSGQKPNIAPEAIVTTSNCRGGPCSALNDQNYGSCTNSQVYISTSNPPSGTPGVDFIEWNWPSVKTFNKIIIHYGSGLARLLQGGTMQKWDGSQWVTTGTFSGLSAPACTNVVSFPKVTAERFRITAFQMSFGQTSNPDFREIEIFAATTSPNDAGVTSSDSLQAVCPVSSPVKVRVQNFGTNLLDSVLLNWEVNGVTQTPVWHSNQLDTLGGSGLNSAEVTLGNYSFSANTTYQLKYWTSMPNGTADSKNINDTLRTTISLGAPTGVLVSNITDTTAQIDWNLLGGSNFELIYGPSGFNPASGGNTITATSSPALLNSLTPGTDYDIYLTANCGSGTFSDTSAPVTFRTLCFNPSPAVLPYYENFDAASGTYLGDYMPVHCTPVAQWHFETSLQNSGRLDFSGYSNSSGGSSKGASLDAIGGNTSNYLITTLDLSNYDTATTKYITLSFSHLDHGDDAGLNDQVWVRGDTTASWINIYNLDANSINGQWAQATNLDLTAALRGNNQNFGSSFQVRFGQDGNNEITSMSASDGRTFDNIEIDEKSCLEIPNINLYYTDTSQVGFAVSDSSTGFDYQWGPCGFNQATATIISNQTGADTLQGLYPNTCYEIYIRQNCDTNGISGWTGPFSFSTNCASVKATYNQNFDGAPAQDPFGGIECWSISGPGANDIELQDNLGISASPVSMPNAAELNPGNLGMGDTAALISPWLADLSGADKRIEFHAAFEGANEQLFIGLLDNANDLSTLQIIDSISTSTTGSFIKYTVNLNDTNRVANARHVAFIHGSGSQAIYLDNFAYTNSPPCLPPLQNSMGIHEPSANTTELYWGAGSEGIKTYVEVGPVGFSPGFSGAIRRDSVPGGTDTITIYGLAAQSSYEFYIQDSCSADGLSPWIGPFSFQIPCNVFASPFAESFESNSTSASCWSNQYVTASSDWVINSGSGTGGSITSAQDGINNLWFQTSGSHITQYVSPRIDISNLTNAKLSFYYAQEIDILGLHNSLKVYVRKAGSGNWTEVFSDMQAKNTWTYQEVILPLNLGNDTIEIAFEGISGSSLIGGVLDNINIGPGPSCVAPTDLSVSSTTNNSTVLNWQERSPAGSFEVWYGPRFFYTGTQTTTGTKTITSNNSLPLNTLMSDTCYEFLVRSICANGDSSTWTGPVVFCTDCGTQPAPYFQDFESAFDTIPPDCWTNVKGEGMADWLFDDETSEKPTALDGDHTKGPNGGGIMAWLDGSNNANFTELLTPNIDISGLSQPELSFWLWSETNNSSISRQFPLHIDVRTASGWINNVGIFDVENTSWEEKTVNLSAFSGIIQIRFRGEDLDPVYYKDIAIDDVEIAEKPLPCNMPTNVWANASDCDSIEVTWNTNASNSIVSYGPPGSSPGGPNSTSISMLSSPFTIGGLSPNTSYEIYVASVCGSDTTNFVGPVTDVTYSGPLPAANFSLSHSIVNGVYEVYLDASISANAESYSWSYLNGNGSGLKDTIEYTQSDNGTQTIRLIVSNGCGTDTLTKTVNVNIGLEENHLDHTLKVYPNPADNELNIHFDSPGVNQGLTVSLSDISGREVVHQNYHSTHDGYKLKVDVSSLSKGVYVLKITCDDLILRKKINIR